MESRPMNKMAKAWIRSSQIPKLLQRHSRLRIHKQNAGVITNQLQPAALPVHLKPPGQEIVRNQQHRHRSLHGPRDLRRRSRRIHLEEVDGLHGEGHRQVDVRQEDRLLRRRIAGREELQRLVFRHVFVGD